MRKRTIVTVAAASATLAAVAASMPANAVSAKAPQVSDPIAEGLAGPLQLDVNQHGIAFSQSFTSTVSKLRANGTVKNLISEPGGQDADVSGVLLTKRGVFYTYTNYAKPTSKLKFVTNGGEARTIANLWKYEEEVNPDQDVTYGVRNISQSCETEWDAVDTDPAEGQQGLGPAKYTGLVDSHPYALAKAPGGGWYVAEAAGNDILKVSRSGNVRSVAVLPPQRTVITEEGASANQYPDCVVGKSMWTEPVPTDVEVLDGGKLVVSLLPGGPEDPSFGPRGKVVRVNPDSGVTRTMASGFAAATNIAMSDNQRRVFVTNLFGGSISKLTVGGTSTYVDGLNTPAAVDWYDGKLYATTRVFPEGEPPNLEFNGEIRTIG